MQAVMEAVKARIKITLNAFLSITPPMYYGVVAQCTSDQGYVLRYTWHDRHLQSVLQAIWHFGLMQHQYWLVRKYDIAHTQKLSCSNRVFYDKAFQVHFVYGFDE